MLSVKFIAGDAGVIISTTCLVVATNPSSASWGLVSMTGFGHLHDL
jgi:hypothetical protein